MITVIIKGIFLKGISLEYGISICAVPPRAQSGGLS
jgi:hypothetical protein